MKCVEFGTFFPTQNKAENEMRVEFGTFPRDKLLPTER